MTKLDLDCIPQNWKILLPKKEWDDLEKKNLEKLALIKSGEIAPNKPNTNALKKYKEGLQLNDLQRSVLIGLALGDGHFCKQIRRGSHHYKIVVEQKKEEYVNFLYTLFAPWVLLPASYSVGNKDTKCFSTISHASFDFYGNAFYKGKTKVWPDSLKNQVNDISLAIWFMDDGSRKGSDRIGIHLNTQCFTKKENQELANILENMGIIPCTVGLQNEGGNEHYRLYLNGPAEMQLRSKIAKYILPCFEYKLPLITTKKYLQTPYSQNLSDLYPPSLINSLNKKD